MTRSSATMVPEVRIVGNYDHNDLRVAPVNTPTDADFALLRRHAVATRRLRQTLRRDLPHEVSIQRAVAEVSFAAGGLGRAAWWWPALSSVTRTRPSPPGAPRGARGACAR